MPETLTDLRAERTATGWALVITVTGGASEAKFAQSDSPAKVAQKLENLAGAPRSAASDRKYESK